jgi:AraC-like DNA-binding protein
MPNRFDKLPVTGSSKTYTPDEAKELAHAMYGSDVRVESLARAERLTIGFKAIHFGATQLLRINLAGVSFERSTDDFLHLSIPLTGGFRRRTRAITHDFGGAGRASVGRPFDRTRLEVADASILVFYAPRQLMIDRAERLTGNAHNAAALMRGLSDSLDLGEPIAAALARQLRSAMIDMSNLAAIGAGALAAAATEEMLVNLMTAAMFPRVTQLFSAGRADHSPALVRRARDYIKAHAEKPIEVSRLAADLGISMRALQENFQRYLGMSPRDLIQECRLERARDRLLVDDDRLSVTTVALDSGFSDLGHFSAKYRERFGELPSETLRRVRRAAEA